MKTDRLFLRLSAAAAGEKDSELEITSTLNDRYNRESNTFPWKTHLQRLRAVYGLVMCLLMIIFQDWRSLAPPFNVPEFFASYISVRTPDALKTRRR